MRNILNILCFLLLFPFLANGQDSLFIQKEDIKIILPDSVTIVDSDSLNIHESDSLYVPETSSDSIVLSDSISTLLADTLTVSADSIFDDRFAKYEPPVIFIDTAKIINYWKITERTGEIIVPAFPDTALTDYFNRTNVEGMGLSVAYLGNLGLPMESRVFFDRENRSNFMFLDSYWAYKKTPGKFNFINTKIPHSNVSYLRAGSRANMEERLQALLAVNAGKKLNFGFDIDYLYARGFYNYQGSKHVEWTLFGNYIADRHRVHVFINPYDYNNGENGGITNDTTITHPEREGNPMSKSIPTNLTQTWNHLKGSRYYLNYHYNLGFERKTAQKDENGNDINNFIPVSSIIYTFDYQNHKRRFYTQDSISLDKFYDYLGERVQHKYRANDSTSHYSIRNTLALSLREGFHPLAKFDATVFVTHDIRNYTLMDDYPILINDSIEQKNYPESYKRRQYSTYIGGELAKRSGDILTYQAQGSLGIAGYNIGDVDVSGNVKTNIPLFNHHPSVIAKAYFKNIAPTFYENNYNSKYFYWRNDFSKTRKLYLGGAINFPLTNTYLEVGVENITNYIYFDSEGFPTQDNGDIQVMAITLKQDFKFGKLNWNNRLVYQTSSDQTTLPLPDFAAYSSLYLDFKIAKVLTIQMGANVHYWTKYYSPTYNPATQQFMLQNEENKIKVGNYPLISGFLNCHLKQARFFVEYYNASSMFISPTEYFSLPHYPVNPTVLKLGISVDFIK